MDVTKEKKGCRIVRDGMVLDLSEVPKALKYCTSLWKLGGTGNEPWNTNTFKKPSVFVDIIKLQ